MSTAVTSTTSPTSDATTMATSPTGSTAGPSSGDGSKSRLNLTTLDKIKRFFFSKEEWDAYLLEKMEEQDKKKGGNISLETKSDNTAKRSVVSWLKTVFPSQEDASTFLKTQIDKLQEQSDLAVPEDDTNSGQLNSDANKDNNKDKSLPSSSGPKSG
ncbi:uncharacterized protein LOC141849144 [Brevipalpus obovatus]|uniref:uncharacterized protein LOC141849144 n=1 Tax=Brevipalpus obovatus TaxID=246614 RepID=UPI003D9E6156